jgi:tetratricopeptide (TPR) repeat protein
MDSLLMAVSRSALLKAILAGLLSVIPMTSLAAEARCERLRPDNPSDYYAARGCGLLQVVEQYHLGPAQRRMRERFWSAAFGDLQFILNQFPNHPQALLLMAQVCDQWPVTDRERGARCDLEPKFVRAIEVNPEASGTFNALGTYEHRVKRFDKAVKSYKRAVELDPSSISANYNLALSYLELKQYDEANTYAQKAYELGAVLPGLRDRLQRAGQWRPGAAPSAPATKSADTPSSGAGPATVPAR